MHSLTRIGGVAGLALGVSACGTLYTLDVTAYNDPNHQLGKTYVILSGTPDLNVNSPEFAAYAEQVERALDAKGYERVEGDELAEADLGVYVAVAIGDPSKRYHTVSTGIYERPYNENPAAVRSSGNNTGGQGGQQTVIPPEPPREILTGYEESGFATTVYTKYLNLVAVDLQQYIQDIAAVGRNEAVPHEIWSIDIETTGKPSELSEVVPVMLAAGQPYVADSTDDVVRIKINGTDKRIDRIRGED